MKAFLLIFSLGWFVQGFAQQDYFMFIQSENRQPFYVRYGEKNYSSSATGHVILSRLKDSAYQFTIGFPQNQVPEQEFTVRVGRRDRGFELKNLGEKGWALFDWQTMELINAARTPGSGGGAGYSMIKRNDDFAKLMSSVVNDTAVMYTVVFAEKKQPVLAAKNTDTVAADVARVETRPAQEPEVTKNEPQIKKEEQQADTVRAVNPIMTKDVAANDKTPVQDTTSGVKENTAVTQDSVPKETSGVAKDKGEVIKESTVAKLDPPIKKPESEDIVPKKAQQDPMKDSVLNPPALPVIAVVKEFKTDTGYHLLVTDELKDSIDIFIPSDVPVAVAKEEKPVQKTMAENEKKTEEPAADQPQQTVTEQPKPQETNVAKQDTADTTKSDVAVVADVATDTARKEKKLFMINSDCRAFATVNDVDKLRVKLINEKDAEGRLAAARKVFKTRCFSALQVKALSEMFPLDEQKYKFFEMAYPFVSDTGNFKSLVSLLQDPEYVQRFRKLVRLD